MVAEHKAPKISVGITSLVVIFTVLCLTVFSVMTLSTAMNEKRLSEKSAEAVEHYYSAEKACAALVNELGRLWENGAEIEELEKFAENKGFGCKLQENLLTFSYTYPIDENQALFVELTLGDTFEITRWTVQTTGEWIPDDGLQVWDGEDME